MNVGVKQVNSSTKGIQYGLRTNALMGKEASSSFCKSLQAENIDCYVIRVNYDIRLGGNTNEDNFASDY